MTRKTFQITLIAIATLSLSLDALAQTNSVFGYPGSKCPAGSEIFEGPEAALAKQDDAVYCQIRSSILIFEKTEQLAGCPPGLKAYKGEGVPGKDVLWCEKDPGFKIPPPPPKDQLFDTQGKPIPKN